jgi:hypothetical protein
MIDYSIYTWDYVHDHKVENGFYQRKYESTFHGITGNNPDNVNPNRDEFSNYDFRMLFDGFRDVGYVSFNHSMSNGACATQLLAETNPNKYSVNGPVSFLELKDIPKMLKLAGNNIIENAAGATLSWQFGWKPLIADIKKVLNWQALVNKKVGELHHLHQQGGLRRRRDFGSENRENTSKVLVRNSWSTRIEYDMQVSENIRKWGSVRWLPTSLPPKDETEYRKLAFRIAYGLEFSAANIWELLPWSWLVDWFSNIGTYMSVHNNIVPVQASTPCIMTRKEKTVKFTPTMPKALSGGNGSGLSTEKFRQLTAPGLTAGIPFLTGRQLSILGSLAILRLK